MAGHDGRVGRQFPRYRPRYASNETPRLVEVRHATRHLRGLSPVSKARSNCAGMSAVLGSCRQAPCGLRSRRQHVPVRAQIPDETADRRVAAHDGLGALEDFASRNAPPLDHGEPTIGNLTKMTV